MGLIEIENMEFYAYHGHYEEERIVGNRFLLNIKIFTDTKRAEESDNINDALNYQTIYGIIKEQMQKKSHLLENIAKRILDAIYIDYSTEIIKCELKVSKINPPMGGKIEKVSLTLSK
jgi:dihydroneopterin aldolase